MTRVRIPRSMRTVAGVIALALLALLTVTWVAGLVALTNHAIDYLSTLTPKG